jgi:1-acyl-sn-glycerol-3-phosphate acyltransferase
LEKPVPGPRPLAPWRRALLGLLRLFGWKTSFVWPPEPKGIILVYPHTSNWDFPLGLAFRIGHDLPANWIGKAEMFPRPFRRFLERVGGIPVDRSRATGFIDAMVQEYRRRNWMWVAITPEGTRSHTDHFKSGFYQLALAANVPVALAYIDYGSRTVGMDTYVRFTGDEQRDLDVIRQFYSTKRGCKPELAGEIRFKR